MISKLTRFYRTSSNFLIENTVVERTDFSAARGGIDIQSDLSARLDATYGQSSSQKSLSEQVRRHRIHGIKAADPFSDCILHNIILFTNLRIETYIYNSIPEKSANGKIT